MTLIHVVVTTKAREEQEPSGLAMTLINGQNSRKSSKLTWTEPKSETEKERRK